MLAKHCKCRLCESPNLSCALQLPPVPVGEHYSTEPYVEELRFPCDIYFCWDCLAVQTQDDIDSEFLWKGYTYFSGQSDGIVRHFEDVSREVLRLSDGLGLKVASVFDVGSNDGTLLASFARNRELDVWGVDPAETVVSKANASGIETYLDLFGSKTLNSFPAHRRKADIVTAFNVFAHSNDLPDMLKAVSLMLTDEGLFVFEVQYLVDVIEKNILGTFFHEHMVHYSVSAVERFLQSQQFKIIDIHRNAIQMGSIVIVACRENLPIPQATIVQQLKVLEKELCLDSLEWGYRMRERLEVNRNSARNVTDEYASKGWKISAYGAARSGPSLLIFHGIDQHIQGIYDDHWMKVGKYSPFKNLLVQPTVDLLNQADKQLVVITAYIHAEKIIEANRQFLSRGGRFLLLWPDVHEVSLENIDRIIEVLRETRRSN